MVFYGCTATILTVAKHVYNPPHVLTIVFTIVAKSQEIFFIQGQGNVREFDTLSEKIDILTIVRENWDLSGKTNYT